MKKVAIVGAGISGLYLANELNKNTEIDYKIFEKKDYLNLNEGYGIQLSVNSANSGDGNEIIKADFDADNLNISFNSKYLIDIASEIEDKKLKINLKDSVSPVLIEDLSDKNSFFVIMPMKI